MYDNSPEALIDLVYLLQFGTEPEPEQVKVRAIVTRVSFVNLQLPQLPDQFASVRAAVLYECVLLDLTVFRCFGVGVRAVAQEHCSRGLRIAQKRRAFDAMLTVRTVLAKHRAADHPRRIAIAGAVEDLDLPRVKT